MATAQPINVTPVTCEDAGIAVVMAQQCDVPRADLSGAVAQELEVQMEEALDFCEKYFAEPRLESQAVASVLALLAALLAEAPAAAEAEAEAAHARLALLALAWGVGGDLDEPDRRRLDKCLLKQSGAPEGGVSVFDVAIDTIYINAFEDMGKKGGPFHMSNDLRSAFGIDKAEDESSTVSYKKGAYSKANTVAPAP